MTRHFSKDIHPVNNHMKKSSAPQIIGEMRIKTTMRYHVRGVWLAIIKKYKINRCWKGCGEKGMLIHCCWECKLVQQLWKTVWRFLKELKTELPINTATPILSIY